MLFESLSSLDALFFWIKLTFLSKFYNS